MSGNGAEEHTAELHDHEGVAAAVDRLAGRARSRIELQTPDLEPRYFDREAFVQQLERFCLDHRDARVRLLVGDPLAAVRRSRRLLPLARRLTSYFELRRLSPARARSPRSLLIVDDRHAVYRPNADRPGGVIIEDDPARVQPLADELAAAYADSEPDTEFRGLSL